MPVYQPAGYRAGGFLMGIFILGLSVSTCKVPTVPGKFKKLKIQIKISQNIPHFGILLHQKLSLLGYANYNLI